MPPQHISAAAAAEDTKLLLNTQLRVVERSRHIVQYVSLDSPSFIMYPEIKDTEVKFSTLKQYLGSFYFRIDNETGGIQRNTLYKYFWLMSHVRMFGVCLCVAGT